MPRENFGLVQVLRGLAALWVVLFHLEKGEAIAGLTSRLPRALSAAVFSYGSAGVAVFFALSGFVIAHSLERKEMTFVELGRFAARRSIRLDPPYWASMIYAWLFLYALASVHGDASPPVSWTQVLTHLTYTQELLHVPELQVVYWTLTYEIQFYLVFAVSMLLNRRAFWALYTLGMWSAFQGHEWALHGLFVNLWHGFLLGVLAYRCGYLRQPAWPLLLLAGVTVVFRDQVSVFAVPCAATALMLFVAARTGLLNAFNYRPLLWLGSISYSLYLVHVPTLRLFAGAWQRLAGRGLISDTLAGIGLVVASIVVAAIFHRLFEVPSHRLAKRLFRPVPAPPALSAVD